MLKGMFFASWATTLDGSKKRETNMSSPTTELKIVSHSGLLFWWPVWLTGFVMAFLTWIQGQRLAIVPAGTEAREATQIEGYEGPREALVAPGGGRLPRDSDNQPLQPYEMIAQSKSIGVIYTTILLLVILSTNVAIRGPVAVISFLLIVIVSVFFAVLGWWDPILHFFFKLSIHINALGYLSISSLLFVMWAVVLYLDGKSEYIVFTPKQIQIQSGLLAKVETHDIRGLRTARQADDYFRELILGFRGGDLIVTPKDFKDIYLRNVIGVRRKHKKLKAMIEMASKE